MLLRTVIAERMWTHKDIAIWRVDRFGRVGVGFGDEATAALRSMKFESDNEDEDEDYEDSGGESEGWDEDDPMSDEDDDEEEEVRTEQEQPMAVKIDGLEGQLTTMAIPIRSRSAN